MIVDAAAGQGLIGPESLRNMDSLLAQLGFARESGRGIFGGPEWGHRTPRASLWAPVDSNG
eukprot:5811841-Pyramimonas_sp.AAC.1